MKKELKEVINKYQLCKVNAMEVITCGGKYKSNVEYLNQYGTKELFENLDCLLKVLNVFRQLYNKPFIINSGFRASEHNANVGGVKNSKHTQCLAVDIKDIDGEIDEWFLKPEIKLMLQQWECAVESPRYTKNWAHFQATLPASKKIVFKPYTREPNERELDEHFSYLKEQNL